MAETVSSGKLEKLARLLGWPLVAIIFMALFFVPISKWLGTQDKASEITLGVLSIKFDTSTSKALTPDPETADAVSKLSPDQLDFLLARPEGQTTIDCSPGQFNAEAPDVLDESQLNAPKNWAALEDLGLASSAAEEEDNLAFCNPGGMRAHKLTEKGGDVRAYVSRVATQMLKFEKKI